jgi:nucleoside 2-deoxyribosyltransferase
MKIYVASSWRNGRQNEVVNFLREAGHEVYDFKNPSETDKGFDWADIDPNWEDWTTIQYVDALQHPIAEKGFNNDFNAMKWADACVLVLPCGRSAHTEAGWMAGQGKPVIVLLDDHSGPELMYKIYDKLAGSINDVQFKLTQIEENPYACFGREPHRMDFDTAEDYQLRIEKYDEFEAMRKIYK